jgi:hypothetical protein
MPTIKRRLFCFFVGAISGAATGLFLSTAPFVNLFTSGGVIEPDRLGRFLVLWLIHLPFPAYTNATLGALCVAIAGQGKKWPYFFSCATAGFFLLMVVYLFERLTPDLDFLLIINGLLGGLTGCKITNACLARSSKQSPHTEIT